MPQSIDSLLKMLRGATDLSAHYKAINRFVAQGQFDQVLALAKAAEERRDIDAEPWMVVAIFDRGVRALALHDHPDAAAAALRLGLSDREQSTRREKPPAVAARELAQLLATGQSLKTLRAMLSLLENQAVFTEVLACWTQELIVKNYDLSGEPSVITFWSRLAGARHPLSALPLRLTRVEKELHTWLPRLQVGGASRAMPFGPSDQRGTKTAGEQTQVVATELPTRPQAASVVSNWEQESNGRSETRRFRFDRPLSAEIISTELLETLQLACLEAVAVKQVTLRAIPTEHALNILFSASAGGGAYNVGRQAAYGRLELWQSVAGLIGECSDIDALADQAARWDWFSFDAKSDWFWQVAWDLGIAALSPDGLSVSVLAATDTD